MNLFSCQSVDIFKQINHGNSKFQIEWTGLQSNILMNIYDNDKCGGNFPILFYISCFNST